ncbi:MAG: heme-binding protein [Rhodomicrobium sp.]
MIAGRTVLLTLGGIAAAGVVAAIAAGPVLSRVEQPDYKISEKDGPIEIRDYGPMIAAEATVEGERKPAIEEGFRLIAAYIFGKNEPRAKIEMTAPVEQEKAQKIAMTAPVTEQAQAGNAGNVWTVRFIMPKEWTMQTLPAPSDPRVTLKPYPGRRFLAITFSGVARDPAIAEKTGDLRDYAAAHKLATVGEPVLAFYNPPWTLPFLRRNEIMLELAR